MRSTTSSSIFMPSIGLTKRRLSAYGKPVSATPTFDNATVIRYDGTGTCMSVTGTASKPPKRHTWSPSSQASQVPAQRPRARASSASASRFDRSAEYKLDTSQRGTHLPQSPGSNQATYDEEMITASPLPLSPVPSAISTSSSQTRQSYELPSRQSFAPIFPMSPKHKVVEGEDGYSHFPDFDRWRNATREKLTRATTATCTEPPRSSCEQTIIGGTVPSKDEQTASPELDTPTQAETSISIPPSLPPTTVQPVHTYTSFSPFPFPETEPSSSI
jgi:hypothetical protein